MIETQKILNLCDDCGACIKSCMFLSYYCDSPKDLAKRFMRNPMENIEIPYSCSLCGLCKQVCHLELYPGDMCLETRRKIFTSSGKEPLPDDFVYDFVVPKLYGFKIHQDLSTSSLFTLSRRPEPANGGTVPRSVFFPGCSLPAYSPSLVIKSYQYLRKTMPGIGIVLNCCGKPSRDLGDEERFRKMFDNTVKIFSDLGVEEVVVGCINCHKIFREHSDIKLRTLYDVMLQHGVPENVSGDGRIVSIHDSCPARDRPDILDSVREIMTQLGYTIGEMRYKKKITQCCGAGGCAPSGNKTLTDRHTRERVSQAKGQIVTYCAHCRERFSSYAPSLHILDYIFSDPDKKHIIENRDSWRNWLNRWYLMKRLQLIR